MSASLDIYVLREVWRIAARVTIARAMRGQRAVMQNQSNARVGIRP
ncbi:MAG TPA: hypothetical protein VFB45_19790 [Pseudolabrys sp.]|nr:hypothetical protein [Pseudolabrys sp.]